MFCGVELRTGRRARPERAPERLVLRWLGDGRSVESVPPTDDAGRRAGAGGVGGRSIGHGVIGPGVLSRSVSIGLTTAESYFAMLLKQQVLGKAAAKKTKPTRHNCNALSSTIGC